MIYYSTKTYEHIGSTAFRQWRAESHCRFLHGYSFTVKLIFASKTLDKNFWVIDFGGLKKVKAMLERMLDHTTLVANDDPDLEWFREAHARGIMTLYFMAHTGCEKIAEEIYNMVEEWLIEENHAPRVWLDMVEVKEHGANGAIFDRYAELNTTDDIEKWLDPNINDEGC